MTFFFSPSTHGFYHSDYGQRPPADVIEISDKEHARLLQANRNGEGRIVPGDDGRPILVAQDQPIFGEVVKRKASKAEFLRRFTEAEQISLAEARMKSPQLWLLWEHATGEIDVDLSGSDVRTLMDELVRMCVLTQARANEIIA